jgi:hypothetical protein
MRQIRTHSLAAFAARPGIETYREIATDAQALGQWTERREAALALLRNTIRALFAECGRPDDFAGYVAEVRASHKPKRNLMKSMFCRC